MQIAPLNTKFADCTRVEHVKSPAPSLISQLVQAHSDSASRLMSPCCYVFYFGLAKGTALGQLANGSLRDRGVTSLLHNVWENLVEEFEDVSVDLLELEQEGIMTFRTVDLSEPGIADMLCDFLLLGKCE